MFTITAWPIVTAYSRGSNSGHVALLLRLARPSSLLGIGRKREGVGPLVIPVELRVARTVQLVATPSPVSGVVPRAETVGAGCSAIRRATMSAICPPEDARWHVSARSARCWRRSPK